MRRSSVWLAVLFLAVFCVAMENGHAAELSESAVLSDDQSIPEGMTSLFARGNSVSGKFEFDGVPLSVETRRGQPTSAIIRRMDPSAPLFEIDVRVLDENEVPIFVQVGGHGPIDASWQNSFDDSVFDERKLAEKSDAITQRAFVNAGRMIAVLKKVKFRNDLLPEYEAIMNLLPIMESGKTVEKWEGFGDNHSSLSSAPTDKHSIEIWKKSAFFPGNIVGDHSGTVAKVISSSGSTYQIWSACNHGTCPGTGMSKKCVSTFSNRAGFCQAAPMCSTPLQWDQKDWWNDDYRHVCNDDSYIQYYRIKYNADPSTSGGTCSDTSLRTYAPDCF